MRERPGYTLVEMIVAMALIGATVTAVAVATSGMHRACNRIREQSQIALELERFTAQFRSDAHEATSASLDTGENGDDASQRLVFATAGGETVRYTIRSQRIERLMQHDSETIHRETYRLPESSAGTWQLEEGGAAPKAVLTLTPDSGSPNDATGIEALEVRAAVGLFRMPPANEESRTSAERVN